MLDEALRERISGGLSVSVGTASPDGEPASCRAVGFALAATPGVLTVYLPVATAAEAIANIASTGRLTVTLTHPHTNAALQLKGRSSRVRVAAEADRAAIEAWVQAFAGLLAELGMPIGLTLRLNRWPAFAVEVAVEAVFEQTPGPRAGERVRGR
jgi:hypothetical protein